MGREIEMVKMVVINYIKAECVEDYLTIAKELVEKTNALDSGCIKYELCKDANDPLRFVTLEEWESQAALDAHIKAKHCEELIPKLRTFSAKPTEMIQLEKMF